jgi:hypothetical protein
MLLSLIALSRSCVTLLCADPSVSSTILRLFVCKTIGDTSYLTADFSIVCYTSKWYSYAAYTIILIGIYPVRSSNQLLANLAFSFCA